MTAILESVAQTAKPTCRQCGSPYFRHVGGVKHCAHCGINSEVPMATERKCDCGTIHKLSVVCPKCGHDARPPAEDTGPIKVMGPERNVGDRVIGRELTVLEKEMLQPKESEPARPAKARK